MSYFFKRDRKKSYWKHSSDISNEVSSDQRIYVLYAIRIARV